MKLVLSTGNSGKLREFRQMCDGEVTPFADLLGAFEIIEDGDSFAANALIKARTIYEKLQERDPGTDYLVISDDSGISLPVLDGAPGIYSARYAQDEIQDREVTDRDNLYKLIESIKVQGLATAPAYYTAAIAIVSKYGEYVVHGWMHGSVITEARGEKGFGYDPIFIPEGYDQTLGELDDEIKKGISHRGKTLALAKPILEMLKRK